VSTTKADGSITIILSVPYDSKLDTDTIQTGVQQGIEAEYGEDIDISVKVTDTDDEDDQGQDEGKNEKATFFGRILSDTRLLILCIVVVVLLSVCLILLALVWRRYRKKNAATKHVENERMLTSSVVASEPGRAPPGETNVVEMPPVHDQATEHKEENTDAALPDSEEDGPEANATADANGGQEDVSSSSDDGSAELYDNTHQTQTAGENVRSVTVDENTPMQGN